MAAYKKFTQLAYRLHKSTMEGNISWKETVSAGVYQASFSSYSLQISVIPSAEFQSAKNVKISVFGDDGNEIESFTDMDIVPEWLSEFQDVLNRYDMMYETYEIARRTALGTEQAIDRILSELEDHEIPF